MADDYRMVREVEGDAIIRIGDDVLVTYRDGSRFACRVESITTRRDGVKLVKLVPKG